MRPLALAFKAHRLAQGLEFDDSLIRHEIAFPLAIKLLEAGEDAPKWILKECCARNYLDIMQCTPFDTFIIAYLESQYGVEETKKAFNMVAPNFHRTVGLNRATLARVMCSVKFTKTPSESNCSFSSDSGNEVYFGFVHILEDVRAGEELVALNLGYSS
jgi:hypothetical protein